MNGKKSWNDLSEAQQKEIILGATKDSNEAQRKLMSDVKNLYTLKQPLTETEKENIVYGIGPVSEELFEPLDVESLTTQLEEILLGYSSHEYVRGFDAGKNWEGEDEPILRDVESLAEAVAEVLKLIGVKQ